jgi:hypothetical protein
MSDVSEAGREMDAGFRYVLDVYRNVSRMLLACDPMLEQYRLAPYATWAAMDPAKRTATTPATWLAHKAVRQYYPLGREHKEIFTVGAYLFNWRGDDPIEPMCVASMMAVTSDNSNDVYWLGVVGATMPLPRGDVQVIGSDDIPEGWGRDRFKQWVRDGRMLSICAPLLEITTAAQVEARLVKPLVARLEPTAEGGLSMPPV